jgi:tRNA-Thr(GGU) m(6)t(6)A37 methyltransferase TsaA
MEEVRYRPIGIVRSPFGRSGGVPKQPVASQDTEGSVELAREYVQGLKDLKAFSHIILVYHCHLSRDYSLLVEPYLDKKLHGVFATRAPSRPNPIGISIVRLARIEGNILHIQDVDIIDGPPLLDIKPYVPEFDQRSPARIGWYRTKIERMGAITDDGRFAEAP